MWVLVIMTRAIIENSSELSRSLLLLHRGCNITSPTAPAKARKVALRSKTCMLKLCQIISMSDLFSLMHALIMV